jgi:hypothetical protein
VPCISVAPLSPIMRTSAAASRTTSRGAITAQAPLINGR